MKTNNLLETSNQLSTLLNLITLQQMCGKTGSGIPQILGMLGGRYIKYILFLPQFMSIQL